MRVSATAMSKRVGSLTKPGARMLTTQGVKQERERKQHEVDGDECRGDAVGEEFGRVDASLLEDARIGRHEGGGEGALGEDGAEMVGQAEGDEEGVGHGACAEHRGHDHVADEARDAGDERLPTDGGDALDHWWSWAVIPPPRLPERGKANSAPWPIPYRRSAWQRPVEKRIQQFSPGFKVCGMRFGSWTSQATCLLPLS